MSLKKFIVKIKEGFLPFNIEGLIHSGEAEKTKKHRQDLIEQHENGLGKRLILSSFNCERYCNFRHKKLAVHKAFVEA